jgi:hypothetical protein
MQLSRTGCLCMGSESVSYVHIWDGVCQKRVPSEFILQSSEDVGRIRLLPERR